MERLFGSVEIILIFVFFYLLNNFTLLGGDKYPLLRTIVDLILVLFFMIMLDKKGKIKTFQKKIDDYFKTIK